MTKPFTPSRQQSKSSVFSAGSALKTVTIAAVLSAAAIGFSIVHKQLTAAPPLAVLNLSKAVSANETILAAKGLKPEELSVEAKIFAHRMKTEIERLQKDCDCTLLVSSAVIAPSNLPDLTETLLNNLGFTAAELAKAEVIVAERMKALQSDFAKSFP